jgi:NAD/NADP transhydrogenase alpha subunit
MCESFKYEPLKPESDRMAIEFKGIKIKAEAKKSKTNALNLKEQREKESDVESAKSGDKVISLAQQSSLSATNALAAFVLTTGAVYTGLLAYQKMRK